MSQKIVRVAGQFTVETNEAGETTVLGPKEFMDTDGESLMNAIADGTDTILNMTSHLSPDLETAIAVRMQTAYAGWKGTKQLIDSLKKGD